jgi:hypothetical protein
VYSNTLGIHARVNAFYNLALVLGYNASLLVFNPSEQESLTYPAGTETIKDITGFDMLNSVDIRAAYSGLDKVTLVTHNQIEYDVHQLSSTVDGGIVLADGVSLELVTTVFGLYDAVAAEFALNDKLTITPYISNQLGIYTSYYVADGVRNPNSFGDNGIAIVDLGDILTFKLTLDYKIADKASASVGFKIAELFSTHTQANAVTDEKETTVNDNILAVSIPVGIKVSF